MNIRIIAENPFEQLALGRLAGREDVLSRLAPIKPELSLSRFAIRAVAFEAVVGKNWTNVSVVEDLGLFLVRCQELARHGQYKQ